MSSDDSASTSTAMDRVTIRVPDGLLERYDALVDVDYYNSRSEAIRDAMRDGIGALEESAIPDHEDAEVSDVDRRQLLRSLSDEEDE